MLKIEKQNYKLQLRIKLPKYLTDSMSKTITMRSLRVSPSKKMCVICLIENPLKIMKNTFYFTLEALFVLKIFKFLSWLFGHIGKTT